MGDSRANQALRRSDQIRAPLQWIWRVAFRVAAGELKRRSQSQPPSPPDPSYEMPESSGSVIAALARLPAKQRAAIVLHDYADYPVGEVAAILGTAAATVRVHLHRGRKRMRQLLGGDDA